MPGHPNGDTPDDIQVLKLDLSVIKADLPAFTSVWSKCFVQIYVDGSPNPVRTKSTKKAGKHEWGDRFMLPARSETVLRFELKRKALLRHQFLAFAEAPISELLITQQKSAGQDQDYPIFLRPCLDKQSKNSDHWRLLIRLHGTGNLGWVVEERQVDTMEGCMAEIVMKLEAFMAVGDAIAEMNSTAKVVWKVVSAFYMIIKNQVDRYARLEDLTRLMRDSYMFVENVKSFPEKIPLLESTIRMLLSQTVECTMFLRECSGHGFGERLAFSAWTDRHINDFTQSFSALKQSLETGTSIQAALVCFRLDQNVNKLLNAQALLKLGPADMDDASRSDCLPNTRMDILAEIFDWVSTPTTTKSNVYWLHGFPGAGKSTVATTVANIFRDLRRLGAFTFFTRGVASRNDPALLIRTLACQLGEFDNRIGSAVARVIEEVPSIKQAPLRWQFQKLLVEPFASLSDCLREGPILIVIDALDECGQSGAREELLRIIASESSRLPSTIRIFITSRAERDIRSAFTSPHVFVREIDIKSPTNEKDVQTYIHHRMVDIRLKNEWLDLPSDWPGRARTEALSLRASGLFIWAYTACRYIEKGQDPEERLSQLVHTALYADAEAALDGIYVTALESAGIWDDVAFSTDFRDIMGLIIVAENPFTAHTIDLLNASTEGRKRRPCLHTVRHLGTVLQWAEDKPICVMHPSFADFITERRRCGSDAWFIDRPAHHLRVARLCVARLGKTLKKNICGLKLSTSGWNEELPQDVAYSARYWVDHLCNSEMCGEEGVADEIYIFLRSHFLHWIEVMIVMRKARQTIGLMIRLKEWVDTYYADHEELWAFAKDAVRFCQAYTHAYEEHPLLVYQSALPFTPRATTVFQTFKSDPEAPVVAGGFRENWSPLLIEFSRPGCNVISIAYSSDGQYIASASNRSIFVWDSTSGELVTKPIQASDSNFVVIAFSPNNHHIASGSMDGTIRLWDGLSGEQVDDTLEKHSEPVYGLVFSSDGSLLVSASKDQTIIVWDANEGVMVHPPLTGHRKTILSLAFSPVELKFASGSRDRSIRIWDAADGKGVLPPIIHRGGGVTSLVYTPDGNRIISASDDRSIRIWDAREGTLLYNPHAALQPCPLVFTGHKSDIYSIAISPCGALLASASKDTTVRLWDLAMGRELPHLVRQHRLPVRSVTFSHDGKRIVTGSHDATVRVWDVESVGSMGAARLHKALVSHVAFSADGTRIVSGGLDKMVRVWCAESGRALMEPFRLEHEVNVVAFDDDERGERGGVRILAADKDGAVFAWDMATREPLMATPADHPCKYAREGQIVLEGRWIVDKTTDEVLSLLPNMSPAKARSSHGNKIAIGLANGSIVILRFPQLATS